MKLYYAISENSHLIRSDEILSVATPGEGNFITIKKTVTDRLGKPFSECVDEPAAGKQAAGEPASAEKHARRYYNQLNLDPRQNRARQQAEAGRHQQQEKAKQPRGGYPDTGHDDLRLTNSKCSISRAISKS